MRDSCLCPSPLAPYLLLCSPRLPGQPFPPPLLPPPSPLWMASSWLPMAAHTWPGIAGWRSAMSFQRVKTGGLPCPFTPWMGPALGSHVPQVAWEQTTVVSAARASLPLSQHPSAELQATTASAAPPVPAGQSPTWLREYASASSRLRAAMASYWIFTSSTMPRRSMRQRLSMPTVTDTSFTWAARSFSSWPGTDVGAQAGTRASASHSPPSPFSPGGVER